MVQIKASETAPFCSKYAGSTVVAGVLRVKYAHLEQTYPGEAGLAMFSTKESLKIVA